VTWLRTVSIVITIALLDIYAGALILISLSLSRARARRLARLAVCLGLVLISLAGTGLVPGGINLAVVAIANLSAIARALAFGARWRAVYQPGADINRVGRRHADRAGGRLSARYAGAGPALRNAHLHRHRRAVEAIIDPTSATE